MLPDRCCHQQFGSNVWKINTYGLSRCVARLLTLTSATRTHIAAVHRSGTRAAVCTPWCGALPWRGTWRRSSGAALAALPAASLARSCTTTHASRATCSLVAHLAHSWAPTLYRACTPLTPPSSGVHSLNGCKLLLAAPGQIVGTSGLALLTHSVLGSERKPAPWAI